MTGSDNSHPVLHRLRALIVEDDAADAELMVAELRRSGFELSWKRVQTEEEYVAALAEPPEIVLADYSLPQFSGNRALELLQQMGLGVPFVVVSGTVGEEAAAAIIKRGATDYVLKSSLARLGGRSLWPRRCQHTAGDWVCWPETHFAPRRI
jgi:CheY-like chemotaxis protein